MRFKSLTSVILVVLTTIGLTATASAENFTFNAPAVHGYDVVSYHTAKRPVRGNGYFVAEHKGANYLFSSEENKKLFEKNPDKYVPAFGGYCAYGVAVGKKFDGDPEVWRVVDGRLYLNLDASIQDEWFKDVSGHIKKANKNWKDIAHKAPADL